MTETGATKPSVTAPARSRRRRVLFWVGLALVLFLALSPALALFFSTPLLCVEGPRQNADALVVLGGDILHRAPRTFELFQGGLAPRVFISGYGDCAEVRRYLLGKGVPAAAIQTECASHTTRENAQFTIPLLRRSGAKRVILVTSWFHSRRALHCFQHYAPGIQFVSLPTWRDLPQGHWPNRYERAWVLSEYLKLGYYWLRFGICPI
jgi:uncharacterized SAM-binding protein YcdF (DUF218 family)